MNELSEPSGKELLSKTITFMRFPLIVLVVAIHVFNIYPAGDYPGSVAGDTYLFLRNGIARCAVPLFFAISGYLFFLKVPREGGFTGMAYRSRVKKRVVTLLIPYLLWNLPILFFCLKNHLGNGFWEHLGCGFGLLPLEGTNSFEPSVPYDSPLWYVRDLFVMALLSPIVFLMVRNRYAGAVILSGLAVAFCCQWIPQYMCLSATSVLFFSFGAYVAVQRLYNHIPVVTKPSCSPLWLLYPLWVVLILLDIHGSGDGYYSTPWHGIQIIVGCVTVTITCYLLSSRKGLMIPAGLGGSVFFIFCFHYYLCRYVVIPLVRQFQPEGIMFVVAYLVAVVAVIAVCHYANVVGKRFCPRVVGWLCGGR